VSAANHFFFKVKGVTFLFILCRYHELLSAEIIIFCSIVFQPSFLTATGPAVTAFLLGNTSDVSLKLRTVSPSNTTGKTYQEENTLPLYRCFNRTWPLVRRVDMLVAR